VNSEEESEGQEKGRMAYRLDTGREGDEQSEKRDDQATEGRDRR
jgi:hypothetical protein